MVKAYKFTKNICLYILERLQTWFLIKAHTQELLLSFSRFEILLLYSSPDISKLILRMEISITKYFFFFQS